MTEDDVVRSKGGQHCALIASYYPQALGPARDALREEGFEAIHDVAPERIAAGDTVSADLILFDGTGASEIALETKLARTLHAIGSAGYPRLFALVRPDQIDQAAAWLADTRATILCEPLPGEWQFAFAGLGRPATRLHDKTDDEIERLRALHHDIAQIADSLSALHGGPAPRVDAPITTSVSPADLRALLRARRTREKIFKGGLLSDPAWDMLLDLKASELEGNPVSTTSLCVASAAPATTALRWINILEKAKLIERERDPTDRRRMFIKLSVHGSHCMSVYLEMLKQGGLPLA